jgi:hypothetical protein
MNRICKLCRCCILKYHRRRHHHYHHHHMALQPNSGPGLPLWDFVTITFLQGWIVSPAPNPQPGGQASVFMTPETGWALGTHFSRLLLTTCMGYSGTIL